MSRTNRNNGTMTTTVLALMAPTVKSRASWDTAFRHEVLVAAKAVAREVGVKINGNDISGTIESLDFFQCEFYEAACDLLV